MSYCLQGSREGLYTINCNNSKDWVESTSQTAAEPIVETLHFNLPLWFTRDYIRELERNTSCVHTMTRWFLQKAQVGDDINRDVWDRPIARGSETTATLWVSNTGTIVMILNSYFWSFPLSPPQYYRPEADGYAGCSQDTAKLANRNILVQSSLLVNEAWNVCCCKKLLFLVTISYSM